MLSFSLWRLIQISTHWKQAANSRGALPKGGARTTRAAPLETVLNWELDTFSSPNEVLLNQNSGGLSWVGFRVGISVLGSLRGLLGLLEIIAGGRELSEEFALVLVQVCLPESLLVPPFLPPPRFRVPILLVCTLYEDILQQLWRLRRV